MLTPGDSVGRLHEAVTRNHRFESIEELVAAAVEWLTREDRMCLPATDYDLAAYRSATGRELFSARGRLRCGNAEACSRIIAWMQLRVGKGGVLRS